MTEQANENGNQNVMIMIFGPLLVAALFIFFFSVVGYYFYDAFQEARYRLYGETTAAKVYQKSQAVGLETRISRTSPMREYKALVLNYSFQDTSGSPRIGQDEVRLGSLSVGRENETVLVEYIPGVKNASRVKGARSLFRFLYYSPFPLVFLFLVGLLVYSAISNACMGASRFLAKLVRRRPC